MEIPGEGEGEISDHGVPLRHGARKGKRRQAVVLFLIASWCDHAWSRAELATNHRLTEIGPQDYGANALRPH